MAIRSGELDEALKQLDEGRPHVDPKQPAALCMIEMLASITQARLGHVDKAKDALEVSNKIFNEYTLNGSNLTYKGSWHDWYVYLILRQEAESLLHLPAK